MSGRNDDRYGEDACVSFAMYCDENGLTLDEGRELADAIGAGLQTTADDRAAYLPEPAA